MADHNKYPNGTGAKEYEPQGLAGDYYLLQIAMGKIATPELQAMTADIPPIATGHITEEEYLAYIAQATNRIKRTSLFDDEKVAS